MQEKVITVPFNSKLFLESCNVIWAFSNKKKIIPNIFYTVFAIIVLTIGLTWDKKEKMPLATIFGGGYLFYMTLMWIGLFERKVKYFRRTKKRAMRYEKELMNCTYVFSDKYVEYRDDEKSYKFNWCVFNRFLNFRDTILLISKETGSVIFTISRSEIGDNDYLELCDILKEKIG